MATLVTFNGVQYSVPAYNDIGYAQGAGNLSSYLIAIASGALQQTGGNFTITSPINFGASNGLLSIYYASRTANVSSTGTVRLANNSDAVSWRNAANSGDLQLKVNASDQLTFNGLPIESNALTNTHIWVGNASNVAADVPVTGDISLTNTGVVAVNSVQNGTITNVMVNAAAAIAYSKLALSNSIVNADINTAAAIAYSKLNLALSIVNGDISNSAAIAYSKLNLALSIVNADISTSAAIAYSKLALSNSIVDADINTSAAIALTKLAALNASIVPVTNASGFLTSSTVTPTELGYLSGTTSAIQTQINGKVAKAGDSMTGDLTMTLNKAVIFNDNQGSPVAVTVKAPTTVTSAYSLRLPPNSGTNGYFLQTDGAGVTSWQPGGSGTVGAGTSGQIAVYNGTNSVTSGVTASMNNQKITSLANGTASTDAAAFGQIPVARAPTVQRFTSGSGTYTTPTSPAPLYLKVTLVGGGGGGSGGGTSAGGNGGAGGDTSFGPTAKATGGTGGQWGTVIGGPGGSYTPTGVNLIYGNVGGTGGGGSEPSATAQLLTGGLGGNSMFGGGGWGRNTGNGAGNTGGGGGGAEITGATSGASGSGGGGGGSLVGIITSPSATYAYSVGAGGTGGTSGGTGAGGAGAPGIIIVEEFYF